MNKITKHPILQLGYRFLAPEYIPEGKDEYYLRNQQNPGNGRYRKLTAHEIEILVMNHNTSDDWNNFRVSDAFNPDLVRNCKFYGLVRIGNLEPCYLEFHDMRYPVGIYNSTVINCDFGDNVVVDNVNYFANYITGNEVIITNVNEISTSDHAKFGNGILKEGESEEVRIWMEVCNENGGRKVMPFDGMLPGDAWLWSRNRHDQDLQRRFREITEKKFDNLRGYYGTLGDHTVVKNCRIIKDVKTGPNSYLKGANKLKNLTINSSGDSPTQVGEGCELVNGIIGKGCRIFYGVKAVRFILGSNSQLKYGARLINSFLGDNATISCCEVLNSLIFPAHEQHHNNSFLIAATVEGQSNIAAGATIGSNHNSRGADGEMIAARGFWPALCTSIRHNSKFAAYTLLAKSDFPNELNISLPFSLVNNDAASDKLVIMPAYWFMYNLYAIGRNSWKTAERDKRPEHQQLLEHEYLAPDTINSVFEALSILEYYTGKSALKTDPDFGKKTKQDFILTGKEILAKQDIQSLLLDEHEFESGNRPCELLKVSKAYNTYKDFIQLYAGEVMLNYLHFHPEFTAASLISMISETGKREEFVNVGGQLIMQKELDILHEKIKSYEIISWDDIHHFYHAQADNYTADKFRHAISSLAENSGNLQPDQEMLKSMFMNFLDLKKHYTQASKLSRDKDYSNPFRKMVYANDKEMAAVTGNPKDNCFIIWQLQQLHQAEVLITELFKRWKME